MAQDWSNLESTLYGNLSISTAIRNVSQLKSSLSSFVPRFECHENENDTIIKPSSVTSEMADSAANESSETKNF